MVREDRVILSVTELRRVSVIRQTREQQLTPVKAGTLLGLTTRHIRRLLARVAQAGDQGLAHRGRGKPSNRRIPAKVKVNALTLYEKRYGDVGPPVAAEKLVECHGMTISAETMRGWLRGADIEHFTRRKRPHRAWRERKAHVGELVQLDGSHHDGFEGRGPRCVLMADIDDASSQVYARFYAYEGTIPAMDSFMRYVRHYGIPLALDADKPTTSQAPALPTVDEQLAGVKPLSQCGRALGELGVELIPAHSPQAKGRVARLFKTVQDRVIKEMQLADLSTLDAANQFLKGSLPIYNRRFAVQPAQPTDLHRPRPASRDLDRCLCITTTRCLRRDWTVAHQGHLSQVQTNIRATPVPVEERVEGTRRMTHHGRPLDLHAITSRPMKAVEAKTVHRPRCPVTPRPDHPWRTRLRPERTSNAAADGT